MTLALIAKAIEQTAFGDWTSIEILNEDGGFCTKESFQQLLSSLFEDMTITDSESADRYFDLENNSHIFTLPGEQFLTKYEKVDFWNDLLHVLTVESKEHSNGFYKVTANYIVVKCEEH